MQFGGRQLELHMLTEIVTDSKIRFINIHGQNKCGKTSFVKEFIHYYINRSKNK